MARCDKGTLVGVCNGISYLRLARWTQVRTGMTHNETSKVIGRVGQVVVDAKQAYGVSRYLVIPVAGQGSTWVNADRVRGL